MSPVQGRLWKVSERRIALDAICERPSIHQFDRRIDKVEYRIMPTSKLILASRRISRSDVCLDFTFKL